MIIVFTQHVQQLVSKYLTDIGCQVDHMHEFTDGCQCQYKSRHCIGGLSMAPQRLGYKKMTRNYFESAHGKGPQDAAGGCVKNQVDLAIRRGTTTIQSAEDFYKFANKNLQNPKFSLCKKRIFRYVKNIPRENEAKFKAIPRNRSIHQVCTSDTPGEVVLNELSCYSCESCVQADFENCIDSHRAETRKVILESETSPSEEDDDLDPLTSLRDLAKPGCTAALYTDDETTDYYLFEINQEPTILTKTVNDKWGNSFVAGVDVIRGLYYEKSKSNPLKYKLIDKKEALVPTASLRYIFIKDDSRQNRGIFTMTESNHLDIIASIDEN